MAPKKWIIKTQAVSAVNEVMKKIELSSLSASLLVNRDITSNEQIAEFFGHDYEFESPFALKDMQKAVDRINEALENYEKIYIYGDYDCDGITSVAILYTYLLSIGADVYYYIPKREGEGYGLHADSIDKMIDDGANLIITVDNGISAIDEAEYIKSKGVDLIVTDHHQPKEVLPNACAVVNPHRKDDLSSFKELAGVGVAFKLIAALEDGDYITVLESFADIVAIGTIGDVVSLTGENRAIVKYGLNVIKNTENHGLLALMDIAGIDREKITAQNIAFALVPRINASGRMKDAQIALQLLLSEYYEEAATFAKEIDSLNVSRQKIQEDIFSKAIDMLYADKSILNQRVILLKGSDWHQGVLGIVSAKLLELTGKPVFIMTEDNGILKGSARSIDNFDVSKALGFCKDCLENYGGHSLAGGFSLKACDFDKFKDKMLNYAKENFDIMPQKELIIEKEIDFSDLSIKNIKELSYFEPFGTDNETPVFMIKGVKIKTIVPLSNGKHQKICFSCGKGDFQALYFSMPTQSFAYKVSDIVDIAFCADINVYNHKESVTLKIKDMKKSDTVNEKLFLAGAYFEKIVNNEEVKNNIIAYSAPTREECGTIYSLIKSKGPFFMSEDAFFTKLDSKNINYCKFKLIMTILQELALIKSSFKEISAVLPAKKTDLSLSKTYSDLHNIKEG